MIVTVGWAWVAVSMYQVVDRLPAKSADQMNGQLDDEDQQDERGHVEYGGERLECRKYGLPTCVFQVVDCEMSCS